MEVAQLNDNHDNAKHLSHPFSLLQAFPWLSDRLLDVKNVGELMEGGGLPMCGSDIEVWIPFLLDCIRR